MKQAHNPSIDAHSYLMDKPLPLGGRESGNMSRQHVSRSSHELPQPVGDSGLVPATYQVLKFEESVCL